MHQAHTSPSEEAQTGPWRESILDKRKRKEQGGGDGRETQQTQRGKRKEKGKGKKRMGAYGPLVRDIVLAIMPFICTISPFISEKPSPRGCRHCWPNHVNYCVYCRVFSFSNLYLIGLSHSIGLLSCPISLLKRFRTYPFATRVFLTLQLALSVGTDTVSLGLSGGYHRVDRLPIYQTPENRHHRGLHAPPRAIRSSGKEAPRAATRSRLHGLKNPPLRASNRATDTTIGFLVLRSEERHEEWSHRSHHAPPRAGGSSDSSSHALHVPARAQRMPTHARHTPARARHTPARARHTPDPPHQPIRTRLEPDRTQTGPDLNRLQKKKIRKMQKNSRKRKNFRENSGKLSSLLNFFNYKDLIVIS